MVAAWRATGGSLKGICTTIITASQQTDFGLELFDLVITLCANGEERCTLRRLQATDERFASDAFSAQASCPFVCDLSAPCKACNFM